MESSTAQAPAMLTDHPSVAELFGLVPDHRRARSTVSPLAGQGSVLAIAEWGSRLTPPQRHQLGLPAQRTPHQTTIHRVLAALGDEVRLIGEGAISALLAQRRPGARAAGDCDRRQGASGPRPRDAGEPCRQCLLP